MSTTIKGWADPKMWDEGPVGFRLCRIYEAKSERDLPATLIIGDEPLFTEAQVKAMLNELLDQSERDASMSTVIRAVNVTHLAHKHGITL